MAFYGPSQFTRNPVTGRYHRANVQGVRMPSLDVTSPSVLSQFRRGSAPEDMPTETPSWILNKMRGWRQEAQTEKARQLALKKAELQLAKMQEELKNIQQNRRLKEGVISGKYPQYGLTAEGKIGRLKQPSSKNFTPNQIASLRQRAHRDAMEYIKGMADLQGNIKLSSVRPLQKGEEDRPLNEKEKADLLSGLSDRFFTDYMGTGMMVGGALTPSNLAQRETTPATGPLTPGAKGKVVQMGGLFSYIDPDTGKAYMVEDFNKLPEKAHIAYAKEVVANPANYTERQVKRAKEMLAKAEAGTQPSKAKQAPKKAMTPAEMRLQQLKATEPSTPEEAKSIRGKIQALQKQTRKQQKEMTQKRWAMAVRAKARKGINAAYKALLQRLKDPTKAPRITPAEFHKIVINSGVEPGTMQYRQLANEFGIPIRGKERVTQMQNRYAPSYWQKGSRGVFSSMR